MKTISHSQLVKILSKPGAFPVGLLTNTEAKTYKNNPYGEIRKISRSVGFVGAKYENSVNREGQRQGLKGKFKAESRPWGQWKVPNKVVSHNGKLYLRTQSTPGQRAQSRKKVLNYLTLDGEKISYENIALFLKGESSSKKQSEFGLISKSGMTDDNVAQVQVREFDFDSIQKIRVGGQTYRLKNK